MIELGLNSLSKEETEEDRMSISELERNFAAYSKLIAQQMQQTYSFLLTRLQTTNHMSQLSLRQWSSFMT